MYKEHLKEYYNCEIFEIPDKGFVAYTMVPEYKSAHVEYFYVIPDLRRGMFTGRIMKEFCQHVKDAGAERVTCFISMGYHGRDRALAMNMKFGFRLVSADEIKITLAKEL